MASAGTVTVDFAAETARFTAELKKVQGSLNRLEKDFVTLTNVGKTAVRLFTGGVFASLAKSAFMAADATADAAARAGIAVETFSRLQYAANLADADLSALTTAVQRFQVTMSEAAAGNKQANASLAQLGLTFKQLQGIIIEQQLGQLSEQFAKIKDPADRTRIAVDLFGKSAGPQLVPLLAQGKKGLVDLMNEADRLGVTLSAETAAAIDQTDAAVKRLTATIQGGAAKVIAGWSIILLGPPDEIQAQTKEIEGLQSQVASFNRMLREGQTFETQFGPDAPLTKHVNELKARIQELTDAQHKLLNPEVAPPSQPGPIPPVTPLEEIDVTATVAKLNELQATFQKMEDDAAAAAAERQQTIIENVTADFEVAQEAANAGIKAEIDAEYARQSQLKAARDAFRQAEINAEAAVNEQKRAMQDATYSAAIDALQSFAGENEDVARALVIINKSMTIARAIQNTATGVTAALALGPAGIPLATAIKVMGAAQIALIAASGYGQMRSINAHGGAPIGSPVNPIHTQIAPTTSEDIAGAADEGRAVQVVINGNFFGSRETVDYLMEQIRAEINERDVVLFSPASRQAQELRAQ